MGVHQNKLLKLSCVPSGASRELCSFFLLAYRASVGRVKIPGWSPWRANGARQWRIRLTRYPAHRWWSIKRPLFGSRCVRPVSSVNPIAFDLR